jgi:hypothetical protein
VTNEHTGEGIRLTQEWVATHKAEYAYAYFEGSDFMAAVGHAGWPHAALISPEGTILWTGHPASLDTRLIEANLETAITKPLFEWDAAVKTVAEALRARELGKALKEAEKLFEKGVKDSDVALETANRLVKSAVKSVESAFEAGNFLDAHTNATRYAKQLKGLDAATRLEEVIAHCETDPEAKRIVGAQEKLRALLGKRLRKKREADALIEKLQATAKEFEGTYVAVEATRAIDEVKALYDTLR